MSPIHKRRLEFPSPTSKTPTKERKSRERKMKDDASAATLQPKHNTGCICSACAYIPEIKNSTSARVPEAVEQPGLFVGDEFYNPDVPLIRHMLHTSYTHEDMNTWPTLSVDDIGCENVATLIPFAKYTPALFRMFMKTNGYELGSLEAKRLFFPFPLNVAWDGQLRNEVKDMNEVDVQVFEIEKQLFEAWVEEEKQYWDVSVDGYEWNEKGWERMLECWDVRTARRNEVERAFWEGEGEDED